MIEIIFHWIQQLYEALGSTAQISPWTYLLVTLGGVASAISPCYVPVLTMFGGYVGGYAKGNKSGGLHLALPFVFANAATLAIVGTIASLIGKSVLQIFTGYQLDRWIPGVVGLLMGLQLLGILKLKMPVMPIFRWARQPGTRLGSFALGLPFGLVVTPCTIPIFFAIVAFVALQGSVLHGALLMVARRRRARHHSYGCCGLRWVSKGIQYCALFSIHRACQRRSDFACQRWAITLL